MWKFKRSMMIIIFIYKRIGSNGVLKSRKRVSQWSQCLIPIFTHGKCECHREGTLNGYERWTEINEYFTLCTNYKYMHCSVYCIILYVRHYYIELPIIYGVNDHLQYTPIAINNWLGIEYYVLFFVCACCFLFNKQKKNKLHHVTCAHRGLRVPYEEIHDPIISHINFIELNRIRNYQFQNDMVVAVVIVTHSFVM